MEIVDIFRPSQDVLPTVEEAVRIRESYEAPKVIWMQPGIVNDEATRMAREAGMMEEHKRPLGKQTC